MAVDFCESRWDVFGSNTSYPLATTADGRAWQQRMAALRKAASGGGLAAGDTGFHDTEVRLDGPAAYDVALNFAQRWNERSCDLTYLPYLQKPPLPIPLPRLADFPPASGGTHDVQVLRTYSCAYARSSGCYASFAPAGETSVNAALLHLFDR